MLDLKVGDKVTLQHLGIVETGEIIQISNEAFENKKGESYKQCLVHIPDAGALWNKDIEVYETTLNLTLVHKYLIRLNMTDGEFEKGTVFTIQAESIDDAKNKALLLECHDDELTVDDINEFEIDDVGGIYSINKCELLTAAECEVFEKFNI